MRNHVTLFSDSNFTQNKSKDVMMAPGPLQHLLVPSAWHLYAKIQSAPTYWSRCSPVWHVSTCGPFHLAEIVSFRHLCDSIFFKSLSISHYWMKSTLMMLNCPPVFSPSFAYFLFTILCNLHIICKINLLFTFYC